VYREAAKISFSGRYSCRCERGISGALGICYRSPGAESPTGKTGRREEGERLFSATPQSVAAGCMTGSMAG
jgi:hypothetical protein